MFYTYNTSKMNLSITSLDQRTDLIYPGTRLTQTSSKAHITIMALNYYGTVEKYKQIYMLKYIVGYKNTSM